MLSDKYRLIAEMVAPYVVKNGTHRTGRRTAYIRKYIPEALPYWLCLFEKISRSTGKIAHIQRSTTEPQSTENEYAYKDGNYYTLILTSLGRQVVNALINFSPARKDFAGWPHSEKIPELRWSPRLDLLFESAKEREFAELYTIFGNVRRTDLVRRCDALNGFTDQVREQANSARFRERQNAFVRAAKENNRWINALIEECFNGHERLHFACIDLGYQEGSGAYKKDFYPQIKKNGKDLRNLLAGNPFEQGRILGYGLSLRYLSTEGYHFRLLLICAPKDDGPSDWLAKEVERLWIQPDKTMRRVRDHLPHDLTDIKREEEKRREALAQHTYFLTQLDCHVRLKLAPKDPYFFRYERSSQQPTKGTRAKKARP